MKKIMLLLLSMTLLTGCNFSTEEENNALGIVFPKIGNYFCPEVNYNGENVPNDAIFDAAEKCSAWKTDFWEKTEPGAYDKCLQRKKTFVERFQSGTCSPIFKKTHNIGKSGCLFEYVTSYNKVIKYSCYGPDIPKVIDEITKIYE